MVAYGWVDLLVIVKTASLQHSLSLTCSNPIPFEKGHSVRDSLLAWSLLSTLRGLWCLSAPIMSLARWIRIWLSLVLWAAGRLSAARWLWAASALFRAAQTLLRTAWWFQRTRTGGRTDTGGRTGTRLWWATWGFGWAAWGLGTARFLWTARFRWATWFWWAAWRRAAWRRAALVGFGWIAHLL